jgi:hypothetical protein
MDINLTSEEASSTLRSLAQSDIDWGTSEEELAEINDPDTKYSLEIIKKDRENIRRVETKIREVGGAELSDLPDTIEEMFPDEH